MAPWLPPPADATPATLPPADAARFRLRHIFDTLMPRCHCPPRRFAADAAPRRHAAAILLLRHAITMLPCRYAATLIAADDFRHYCHCSPDAADDRRRRCRLPLSPHYATLPLTPCR
jgi:hypothetical protein